MPFSNTVLSSGPYTPNGVTTNFPYFFLALTDDEVQVVLTDADGVETILTTGFDITDIGTPEGGLVVFTVAPSFDGRTLTIRAVPSFAQETDFNNQGSYNPREMNKALDRAAQRAIYLRDLFATGGGGEGSVGTVTWASVQGKPTTFTPATHTHAGEDITTGSVAAARIANLDASKIATGAFDPARIPSMDASKITSGVFDAARIPPTPSGVVASGDITTLTSPQQALITEGVLVTLNDGTRLVYDGSGSKTDIANYVEIGDGTPGWNDVSDKPANVVSLAGLTLAANKLPYATGADTLALADFTATGRALVALASQNAAIAYTSPLTTKGDLYGYAAAPARIPVGTNGQVLTADSAQALGLKWANPTGGTSGGSNMPLFTDVFSGNGDGSTDNDAAFTAAEASAFEYIWLPEGNYKTTKTVNQLTKRYVGPGKIFRGTGGAGVYKGFARYSVEVATPVDQLVEYGLAENLEFSDAHYNQIDAGMRVNFNRYLVTGGVPNGYAPYFWAPAIPEFAKFVNKGGYSGVSGVTSSAITLGVSTSVTIAGGVASHPDAPGDPAAASWAVGQTIGFLDATTGVAETKVLTGVSGSTLTWSGTLTKSYPIGTVVTHGYRTMQAQKMVVMEHTGGGDAYAYLGRISIGYKGMPSQTGFEMRNTGGLIGGDITVTQAGGYGTGMENLYEDAGVDACMAGVIGNYRRTVDTGGYGNFWIHDLAKIDGGSNPTPFGLKGIDGVYVAAVLAKTGVDFTRSAFTVAAVALPLGQKVSFDAQIVAPGAGNGNGWVATTDGGMYIFGTTVSGIKALELQNGGFRLRLLAGSGALTTNAALTVGSTGAFSGNITSTAGYVHGVAGVAVNDGAKFFLDGPGGTTYIQKTGGSVVIVKNGSLVATF